MKYLIILFLVSCSGLQIPVQQDLQKNTNYRRDMIVTVNNNSFEGMGVVKSSNLYKFHVETRGDLDMFILSSCNRDWTKEKAWNVKKKVKSGLFGWGRKIKDKTREVKFDYRPITDIEKTYCPIWLGGYEKVKGRHSWAFIDFRTPDMSLPARLECNGEATAEKGVGVCQSRTGKTQVIKFSDEMVVSPDARCDLGNNRGIRFEFELKSDFCVYRFKRIRRPHLEFRLTTFGYDKILIRQE